MDLRRIATIFRKDFIDAIGDSRILLALVVPLGLGLLYSIALDDEPEVPKATVAYMTPDQSRLPEVMQSLAGDSLRLSFTTVTAAEDVRRQVEDDDADLGLVLPTGFDAAVARGDSPEVVLSLPESTSVGGSVVIALLDPALRQLAGQQPPATVTVKTISPGAGESVVDRLGERRFGVLTAAVMTIAIVGMYVVPTALTDEVAKKTLDALVLIASNTEVVVAKALLGLSYIVIAVPLLFAVTDINPQDPLSFTVGLVLLSVTVVGLGLLLGGMLSANQLTTWGGVILIPVVLPAVVIGMSMPGWLEAIATLVPITHGVRLAINGLSGESLFAHTWVSIGMMLAWSTSIYALLLWRLSRREA